MAAQQRLWIAPGGIEHVEVVQRDDHRRHHRQPIGEGAADQTGKRIHVVNEIHSPHEW